MLRCSAIVSLVAAALFLSPLNSTATEQDHSNPFIAVKLDTVLPKPLSDLTATRVDDVVYIVGGCDAEDGNRFEAEIGEFLCGSVSNKLYRFDPATEQFTELSSMPTPRYRHASVAVKSVADSTDSAVIVVLGGRDVKDDIITTVDMYNIETDTWSTFSDLPEAYWASDLTGFTDNSNSYGYFCGGYTSIYAAKSILFRIDAAESLVQNALVIQDRQPMQFARGDVASVFNVANNFAIVAGGFSDVNDFCEPLGSVEKYSVDTDSWTSLDDLLKPRSDKVLVELDEEHVFAIGGERQIANICNLTEGDTPVPGELTIAVDDVEILHLDLGDWESLADLEFNRFRFAAASYKEDNKFYTFGGQSAYNDTCQCFDTTDEVVVYTENLNAIYASSAGTTSFSATGTSSLFVMLGTAIAISAASLALI